MRELRNVLCRAADLARSARWLDAAVVDKALRRPQRTSVELTPDTAKEALERNGGNMSAAARASGVPRTTFRKLIGETFPGPKKA